VLFGFYSYHYHRLMVCVNDIDDCGDGGGLWWWWRVGVV
jgi:hypothetical protein